MGHKKHRSSSDQTVAEQVTQNPALDNSQLEAAFNKLQQLGSNTAELESKQLLLMGNQTLSPEQLEEQLLALDNELTDLDEQTEAILLSIKGPEADVDVAEEQVGVEASEQSNAVSVDVDTDIEYAPQPPTVHGQFKTVFISLGWKGKPARSARGLASDVAATYKSLSSGDFQFTPALSMSYNTGLEPKRGNLRTAERNAMQAARARFGNDIQRFAIINNGVGAVSHASGIIAHLLFLLKTTGKHEFGHLGPTNLGHAGAFLPNGSYDSYGDGTSFMSSKASAWLNGLELYILGWLQQNKVGLYDWNGDKQNFTIEPLSASNTSSFLKGVLIPPSPESTVDQTLYASMGRVQGKLLLTLYGRTDNSRTTKRFGFIGEKPFEHNGLFFSRTTLPNDCAMLTVEQKLTQSSTTSTTKPRARVHK